jgi:putative sterol carrier protein
MPVFSDTNELYAVMHELWKQIKACPVMSQKLLKSQLIVRFHYKEPDGYITVDGSDGREIKITLGDCEAQPIVELTMKSDVAHAFWSGKENPALALLNGKMMSKGPVNKALALLPVVRPAFEMYPSIVAKLKKSA